MHGMTTGDVRAPVTPQLHPVVLSFRIACEMANLSVSTMRRLIATGRGPRVIKLSDRRIGIRRADFETWLAAR